MKITASLVKELRERTGAGMMECKKALEAASGDLQAAIEIMRKSGQTKAALKGNRIAAEGVIVIKISEDRKKAIMLEVNCETDFAARDRGFIEFAELIATRGLTTQVVDLDQLLSASLDSEQTILEMRENLVAKIGENITVRRVKIINASGSGSISSYLHGNGRIGVLVELSGTNPDLGKDLAMHIAACKPVAILPEELPETLLKKEREIYLAQLVDTDKPAEIVEKIVVGRIQKFISEITLVKQSFIKNPDISVEDLLKQSNAQIIGFARFEVGEGIEKKESDFAAAVKAQIESTK